MGVKVWICRGVIYGKRELVPSTVGGQASRDNGNNRRPAGNGRSNNGPRKRNNNRNNNTK
jgi:small subunit ribosomal protein S3